MLGMTDKSLSPTVVAAIDSLEIVARVVVEGLRAGGHRSPFHGPGTEFQQHRPYRAGDDLRHLDWKLYARSDRLYTRQFREVTDLSVQIVLDPSSSMRFPPTGISKLHYARIIAASLAYLVSTQGSAVGLVTADANGFSYLPVRSGALHRNALIARLDNLDTVREWTPIETIRRATELMKRRGVIIIISDFYDDELGILRELRAVAHRGHDVIMIQTLSNEEVSFGFKRDIELEDLETSERRAIDASAIHEQYQSAMNSFLERCRNGAGESGIDYALMLTDTPPERALHDLLLKRAG